MDVHIEWLIGVVRLGPNFTGYGGKYEGTCTVVRDGNEAKIIAAVGVINRTRFTAMMKALKESGITKVSWERRKKGLKKVTRNL